MKKILNKVLRNDLCSGCGLCSVVADGAVTMQTNSDGFNRPVLSQAHRSAEILSEIDSSTFGKACPALNLDIRPFKSKNYHPVWGEIKETLRGYATDNEIRRAGSSGGVISALAQYCLDKGLVDGVIQIKASEVDPLLNIAVISRSRKNIIAASGSRYAPASPVEALKWISMSSEKYMFIGKPCDVAAVRQMQISNERLRESITYLVSFMCAGTPSILGTHQILKQLGSPLDELDEFRYRGDGWPGLTKAIHRDGKVHTMTYNDSWGKVLNRHLQTRCKICPDGIGEFADIVCADGWEGDENGYPSFEEREGQSLILLRTAKGSELFSQIRTDEVVTAESFEVEKIYRVQPFQFYRRSTILPRIWAMKLLMLKTPSYKGFELWKGLINMSLVQATKAFFGFIVRRKKIKQHWL